ncbi:MAG: TIGR04255 family protein [Saprospiraceae bacterium]|nr:TIGR04255 family protein [Saprospiraceae bacterium]
MKSFDSFADPRHQFAFASTNQCGKLPFKIEPDNLKDTIVEFHYQSEVPHEVLPGLVFELLKGSFKIVPRPTSPWQLDPANFLKLETQDGMLLTDDLAKIHLRKESIIFNTVGSYPGWEQYSNCIFDTMTRLYNAGFVQKVLRIGVRYISEFAGQSIFDVMKGNPQIALPGTTSKNTTLSNRNEP